jgi:hypothetical protein
MKMVRMLSETRLSSVTQGLFCCVRTFENGKATLTEYDDFTSRPVQVRSFSSAEAATRMAHKNGFFQTKYDRELKSYAELTA